MIYNSTMSSCQRSKEPFYFTLRLLSFRVIQDKLSWKPRWTDQMLISCYPWKQLFRVSRDDRFNCILQTDCGPPYIQEGQNLVLLWKKDHFIVLVSSLMTFLFGENRIMPLLNIGLHSSCSSLYPCVFQNLKKK